MPLSFRPPLRLVAAFVLALGSLSGALAAGPSHEAAAEGASSGLDGSGGTPLPTPSDAETGPGATGEADGGAAPSKSELAYGAFQRGFYLSALKLAEPIANLGDPAAQTLLGEIYSRGLGVAQNMKEAARWYEAAAASGSPEGQFRYAMLLLDGAVVAPDVAKARDLMKAAADEGLPLAQYNYGQMLIEAAPTAGFEEAKDYFAKAAHAGVADAQYAMAQLFLYGRGVPADEMKARAWLKAAAINGQDTAQVEYGIWLVNGKGGPAETETGFQFLKRAALRGNPIAINRIAHLYKDGIGTAPDRMEAAKWAVLAKRVENTDPVLDDFFRGLDSATQKSALEAANRFRSS
ncbi:tetratricopeptide repeat protein [Aurantimonas marianensis]|uniref:Sel1 repeat family protein n=1 Tax=Aurantimonas marianensis TaxID=2920428 RepID=A0A9X2H240_9HYPH|nr:tetratricopeptide repeat protein [Aurantimonas marianensis]MCP3054240.1 sel1 repeat family protein [Aurantimonas marianensis]